MSFFEVLSLLVLVVMACLYTLLTNDLGWLDGDLSQFGDTSTYLFPPLALLAFRVIAASFIVSICIFLYLDQPLHLAIVKVDGSVKKFTIEGYERFTTFTVWCWVLEGVYFTLTSLCSLDYIFEINFFSGYWLRAAWILYEVSFSVSFLVTLVVTFVLIPATRASKLPDDVFFHPAALSMHNLNVVFMTCETLLGRTTFHVMHFPFVILFGIIYVLFAWYWNKVKGVFFYFFLDYNRNWAILWHLGLLIMVNVYTNICIIEAIEMFSIRWHFSFSSGFS